MIVQKTQSLTVNLDDDADTVDEAGKSIVEPEWMKLVRSFRSILVYEFTSSIVHKLATSQTCKLANL